LALRSPHSRGKCPLYARIPPHEGGKTARRPRAQPRVHRRRGSDIGGRTRDGCHGTQRLSDFAGRQGDSRRFTSAFDGASRRPQSAKSNCLAVDRTSYYRPGDRGGGPGAWGEHNWTPLVSLGLGSAIRDPRDLPAGCQPSHQRIRVTCSPERRTSSLGHGPSATDMGGPLATACPELCKCSQARGGWLVR
jgi:hypothetical protein